MILVILYILIILIIIIFFYCVTHNERNYIRRALPIQTCAFGKLNYEVKEKYGTHNDFLLSYSLFGNYNKYTPTLLKSLDIIPSLLPEWTVRVYVAPDIPIEILKRLIEKCEVYVMNQSPLGYEAALWRFRPIEEQITFVSLDADDIFDVQRANDIKKWLLSNKPFASFSKHAYFVPLDAGKWGARPIQANIRDMNDYCEPWFGFDEAYLRDQIWPLFKKYGYFQGDKPYYLIEWTMVLIFCIITLMIYTLF